jgi:hypothetical protein
MKLIQINYPSYRLQHRNGHIFNVLAMRLEDGRLTFDPIEGWDDLTVHCQQDSESLLEDIDDTIYNATPEKYEQE